ncbi:MAG: hypothetical protein PHX78_09480 [bacterium]|nr:hypothetical protein [bacterium]
MKFNPDIHRRRSIRLKNYDYSQGGAYFVTICTNGKECFFGNIIENKLVLNEAGEMVNEWFIKIQQKFLNVKIDEFIIMPNHFHCIICIVGADPCVCPNDTGENIKGEHMGSPLPRIIQWFKTMTTNSYLKNIELNKWQPFDRKLWQRNYYEHIIRNEKELNRVREYIINNPVEWNYDEENPANFIPTQAAPTS